MAQQAKAPVTKPDNPSLIPRPHAARTKINSLSSCFILHTSVCVHTVSKKVSILNYILAFKLVTVVTTYKLNWRSGG